MSAPAPVTVPTGSPGSPSPTRRKLKSNRSAGSPSRSPGKRLSTRSPLKSPPISPGMSPSSLARSSSHRLLPSERQKADEQRLRERRRKLIDRGRPGPTDYTPQVDEKGFEADMSTRKGAETMQNAVFVSKTKKPEPGQMGFVEHYNDPGSYEPTVYLTIAKRSEAQSTFSTTMQNGHGGFGTLQSRTLVIPADLNGEALPTAIGGHKGIKETANSVETGMAETPGPAAYTPQQTEVGKEFDMSVMQGAETMPMAVFQSKVARIGDILPKATASNPGPGTYNPNEKMVINHLPGANPNSNLVSKVGRDSGFAGESIDDVGMMTGPDVGPGSYDPMRTIDGERNTVVGRVAVRSQNNEDASFVSTQDRNIFEWMLNEFGNFGVQRPPS